VAIGYLGEYEDSGFVGVGSDAIEQITPLQKVLWFAACVDSNSLLQDKTC